MVEKHCKDVNTFSYQADANEDYDELFSQFSRSVVSDSLQPPWTAACQTSLSITNFRSLFEVMFIESVMPPNHLILCRPLVLLPSIFLSIRVFSKESVLPISWPRYWSFQCIPIRMSKMKKQDFPGGTVDKNPSANTGDTSLILGLERPHVPPSN